MNSEALQETRGASIPVSALATIADLRCARELRVLVTGERAWLRWNATEEAIVLRLMALSEARIYAKRDGLWYEHGHRLPDFDAPLDSNAFVSMHRAVVPVPIHPQPPAQTPLAPTSLRLVPSEEPHETSAVRCGIRALVRWSASVSSPRLERLSAVFAERTVLVLGRDVPDIPNSRRYWGSRVLIPLGFRAEPALAGPAILGALGVSGEDLLLLERKGYDVVPATAMVSRLTRAHLQLACRRAAR
jgi:hypothetical protein